MEAVWNDPKNIIDIFIKAVKQIWRDYNLRQVILKDFFYLRMMVKTILRYF